jgi:hypothetical protein
MMSKYINPYTDFGFKKLFGEKGNKDLLADFLNQLLPANRQIAELNFRNSEQLPDVPLERKAVFDINCVSTSGERFIVEMQKAKIHFPIVPKFYLGTHCKPSFAWQGVKQSFTDSVFLSKN